jgi:hypothetical protein
MFQPQKSWACFSRCVIGSIVKGDARGISSMAAALKISHELYAATLRFFRPAAFTAETSCHTLIRPAMAHDPAIRKG